MANHIHPRINRSHRDGRKSLMGGKLMRFLASFHVLRAASNERESHEYLPV